MPALTSLIDVGSPAFAANAARMAERLAEVRALEARVREESLRSAARSRSAASCCRASAWRA